MLDAIVSFFTTIGALIKGIIDIVAGAAGIIVRLVGFLWDAIKLAVSAIGTAGLFMAEWAKNYPLLTVFFSFLIVGLVLWIIKIVTGKADAS